MIKKAFASSILAAAVTASAASTSEPNRIGVAVGLSSDSTTVRMPIDIAPDMRIEPEFGLAYRDNGGDTDTAFSFGSGFYLMHQPSANINLYYGGKALIDYTSYDYGNGVDDSTTQLRVGGVFGFEYMFDRHFSAGGEAGAYVGFGDATTLHTEGLALLRYYF